MPEKHLSRVDHKVSLMILGAVFGLPLYRTKVRQGQLHPDTVEMLTHLEMLQDMAKDVVRRSRPY